MSENCCKDSCGSEDFFGKNRFSYSPKRRALDEKEYRDGTDAGRIIP